VQQDAGIFSGTVRQVITYGVNRQVTDKEIEEAAKLSGIYDYICTLPDKFDTQMASLGRSLSGGQRQRLVISRELLKNTDILLFDEPTSALDAATTRELQDTILRVFKGKTIVTITHDLSFIASVDQIAVVNNGVVEACGDNSELMEKSQLYRELVEEQSYQEAYVL
jgi:ATP-binding cassette subfamily B protein AbcA/BmrA